MLSVANPNINNIVVPKRNGPTDIQQIVDPATRVPTRH
jgi:hypothetical protein